MFASKVVSSRKESPDESGNSDTNCAVFPLRRKVAQESLQAVDLSRFMGIGVEQEDGRCSRIG